MVLSLVHGSAWANAFDFGVERFLNHFVHRSATFDSIMDSLVSSLLFRGGGMMLLFWYALFDKNQPNRLRKNAELLVGSIPGVILSLPFVRIFAHLMPFRLRPIATPELHFIPLREGAQALFNWSSFPSDHALMFFLLATSIFFVSRRAGVLAYVWAVFLISFPRLYVGFHWPSDFIAGALLGVGFGWATRIPPYRRLTVRVTSWSHSKYPGIFFAALFLYTFEIGTMFHELFPMLASMVKHFGR